MDRVPRLALSSNTAVDARRHKVYEWMLNGYTVDGKQVSPKELAKSEGVKTVEIRRDMRFVQKKLSSSIRSAPAFRTRILSTLNTALERSMRDRGYTIEQIETLRNSIQNNIQTAGEITKPVLESMDRLAKFMQLAQSSNRQLIDLVRSVMDVGGNVSVIVNTGAETKPVTATEAIRIINEQENIVDILPFNKSEN